MRTLSGAGKPPLSHGHLPLGVACTLHPNSEGKDRTGKGRAGVGQAGRPSGQHPTGKLPGKLLLHKGISQKASNIFWISSHSSQIKWGGAQEAAGDGSEHIPLGLSVWHTGKKQLQHGHVKDIRRGLFPCRAISSPLCRCAGQHEGEQSTQSWCCSEGPAGAGTRVSSNLDPQSHCGHGEFRLGTLHSATLAEPCGTALGSTMPQNPGTACWDLQTLLQ